MRIKKAKVKPYNIEIDLVLCPAYNLFFQQLFCHKCNNFKSEDNNYLQCNYIKINPDIPEPSQTRVKEKLISEFSQPLRKDISSLNEFSQRLKNFSASNKNSMITEFSRLLDNMKISNKERAAEDFLEKLKVSAKENSVDSSIIDEFSRLLKKKKLVKDL